MMQVLTVRHGNMNCYAPQPGQSVEVVIHWCGRLMPAPETEVCLGNLNLSQRWHNCLARVWEGICGDTALIRLAESVEGAKELSWQAAISDDSLRPEGQLTVWSCGRWVNVDASSFAQDDPDASGVMICEKRSGRRLERCGLDGGVEATGYALEVGNYFPPDISTACL